MKIAYFNCTGGASGDMLLGAIVDAGLPLGDLAQALAKLNAKGFSISARPDRRGGVHGTHVKVAIDPAATRPSRWQEFVAIVESSALSPNAKGQARRIFQRLGEAEALAHKSSPDKVHLHELGDLDTLVDVCGAVVGLELLGVERAYCSPLPEGSGVFRIAHGPVPGFSPAVAALVSLANAPVAPPPAGVPDAGETVTPTGAAILTTLAAFRQPVMRLERVGHGLGSRDHPSYPNALALWLGVEHSQVEALVPSSPLEGEAYDSPQANRRVRGFLLIETNLDDMPAEHMAYVQERLFALGAKDVWFAPIQMKKNRPGVVLSALVAPESEAKAVDLILRETTTLGVRVTPVRRHEAGREVVTLQSTLGPVEVKVKKLDGQVVAASPEYEACRKLALDRNLPLQDVVRILQREADTAFLPPTS
ncbi:MAG: nickel pincer cofactor biosynthesis protein LarC [SAR202 cluster bacterium]|nr:nickel pincer cofactor biosynthesis protein LarC [SAR202 cluster bacterium]